MVACKQCGEEKDIVKSGKVRGKQRHQCNSCGCNFVEGDQRQVYSGEAKALAILLYGMCKASYGMIARLFKTSRVMVYHWVKQFGERLPEPSISEGAKDIEFDEMWHFIQSKKTKFGFGKRWIVLQGKPSPGLSVIVMLKHSEVCITK